MLVRSSDSSVRSSCSVGATRLGPLSGVLPFARVVVTGGRAQCFLLVLAAWTKSVRCGSIKTDQAFRHLLGSRLEQTIIVPMSTRRLTREEVEKRLVASEREIRALGVRRLALFGSVLRDEARLDSDVDLLVQFSPGAKTFDHFLALFDLLEERLGHRVELVTTEALSPFIGPRILAEAQDVLRAA